MVPVFIIHWNRPERCYRAVYSFLQQTYPCRVIVIDNASEPNLLEILVDSLSTADRVEFIFNERNLGFAGALAPVVNEWSKSSNEPVCVIAAHDVYAKSDAVETLMETLLSDPQIGIAFPNFNSTEKGLWDALRGARLRPLLKAERQPKVVHGTWFPGHCIAIKREVLENGVGFDARFFAYCEDVDLSLSARKKGYSSILVTEALIENTEWGGTVEGNALLAYLVARNSVLLADKHSGKMGAMLRVTYIMAASLKNWITGLGRTSSFSSRARLLGALDALRGRYGPPPEHF